MKWKQMKGGDRYALVTWVFRRPPENITVLESSNSLSEVLASIPDHLSEEEDELSVVHIGQWLIDDIGHECIPHPDHVTSLMTITHRNEHPCEDEEAA